MGFIKRATTVVVALLIVLGVPSCAAMNKQDHTGCLVIAKETLYDIREGSRDRRVATSCGQFQVNDAWEAGVFESYDLWSQLQEGKVYAIRTGGFRVGILSHFPVVLEVKEVG